MRKGKYFEIFTIFTINKIQVKPFNILYTLHRDVVAEYIN